MSYTRQLFIQCILFMSSLVFSYNAFPEVLNCLVRDNKGEPVVNAVVYTIQPFSNFNESGKSKTIIIDQVDKEFIPHVTPVQTGTLISFPNSDKIRHHVYSFSSVKTFEIPLYPPGTMPVSPIVFEKPGIIALGCNIHDWMKAYIFVVETPFFAKTDASGRAEITDIPQGEYDIQVWHPGMKKLSDVEKQHITITEDGSDEVEFAIKLKQLWRPMRAPKLFGGEYR